MCFEFILAFAQRLGIGLDLGKATPNFGGFLRCHAAMSIKIDGSARYELSPCGLCVRG